MSPGSTVARPVWIFSLPAVAVFISFLWFRRKRGALQTDTGGSGESAPIQNKEDTPASVESEVLVSVENNNLKEDIEAQEESAEEVEEVKAVALAEIDIVEDKEEVVEDTVEVVEGSELGSQIECTPEESSLEVPVNPEVSLVPVEEEVCSVTSSQSVENSQIEITDLATPKENSVKAEEASPPAGPSLKGSKKKKNRKSIKLNDSMSNCEETGLEPQLSKLEVKEIEASGTEPHKPCAAAADSTQERDSANNSPSEVMLASPSLSGYSDTHSEGSSDSGKGCSEVLTPSPTPVSGNSVSGDVPVTCIYEFVIPQHLVGRLIGRNGSHIHEIKDNTHATIYIKRHPETPKLKICAIEGSQMDIDSALEMVRHKFPKKRYPNVTLEAVEVSQEAPVPTLPENLQLYLVEGVNNDVILSSLVSAGHFFLQQPTHPTFLSLNRLNSCMAICYAEPNLPALPDEVGPGVLCAAPVNGGWYRAEITSFLDNGYLDVKFVDYGGYLTIAKSELRQIRADFVTLPFQAAECLLADVLPVDEEGIWSEEAKALVEKLTYSKMLQAQVHGYTENSIPLVYLYTVYNNEAVCINEELVRNEFAKWLMPEPVTEEDYVVG